MGKLLIAAAYAVYAAFWIRFLMHLLVWWSAARRQMPGAQLNPGSRTQVWVLTAFDVLLLGRLINVNAALWAGEWVFHASFLLVLLRHLRFFLNPIPGWVWLLQTPGLVAGYILPFSLIYILVVRLLTKHEKYASPANMFLLAVALIISSAGVLMHALIKPDLVAVKLFAFGIVSVSPAPAPASILFFVHFVLVLLLVLVLPTHILTAPLVMLEARRQEQALHDVMHEPYEPR